MADPRISPPRSWGRSIVQTACPLDCPDSCSLAVTVERGKHRQDRRVDRGALDRRLHLRQGPAASTGACTTPSAFCIRRSARAARAGQFARVTWDEALDLIAARMPEARDRFGAESVLPYHYGGSNGLLTNDFADARFFRRFGASRLARTLCAAPTGAAATAMYGKMAGVAYDDYAHARLIVVWGCNPSASGIHLVSHIKQRAEGRRAARGHRPAADAARAHGRSAPAGAAGHRPAGRARADPRAVRTAAGPTGRFSRRTRDGSTTCGRRPSRGRSSARPRKPASRPRDLATLAEWYGTISPAVIRCGWGQERNRNGGRATMAILALPAVGRQVRRARRRLHDEQLRRLGHPGRAPHRRARPRAARWST